MNHESRDVLAVLPEGAVFTAGALDPLNTWPAGMDFQADFAPLRGRDDAAGDRDLHRSRGSRVAGLVEVDAREPILLFEMIVEVVEQVDFGGFLQRWLSRLGEESSF